MRLLVVCFCLWWCAQSCSSPTPPLVNGLLVDSLMSQYDHSEAGGKLEKELEFWKNRIHPSKPDMVNTVQYAHLLAAKFQATGDIQYLQSSDSILLRVASQFAYKDAGPYPGMIRNALTHHQFLRADSLLQAATALGLKRYETAAFNFDVHFELGQIAVAKLALQQITAENDYGYQFRKARLEHYLGDVDSAITAMEAAVRNAGDNTALWQIATSNLADLHLHAGRPQQALQGYIQSLRRDPSDLHSILGIGWIALMHDGNDRLAERIFSWATTKTALPDPIMKLMAVAEYRNDQQAIQHYAVQFVQKATIPAYGGMYNKYLIPICANVLKQPKVAVSIAQSELLHRNTPQTQAWYAFALMQDGQQAASEKVYKESISSKPLEGLEQFYMAQLTKASGNAYAAKKYIQYAKENKYDLSPMMISVLDSLGKN